VPQPAPHDQQQQQQPAGQPTSTNGGQPGPQQLESELQALLGPGYAAVIAEKGLSVGHMAGLYAELRQQAAARRQQALAPGQDAGWPGAGAAPAPAGRLQPQAAAAAAPPGKPALAQAVEDLRLPAPAYADLDPPPPRFTSTTASGSLLGTPQGPTPVPPSRPLTAQQRRPPSARPSSASASAAAATAAGGEEGPSRAELLRMLADYEAAYESVKERLEVQYRHELGRAEHLQGRLGERDAQLVAAQEEAHALRRCGQRSGVGPARGAGPPAPGDLRCMAEALHTPARRPAGSWPAAPSSRGRATRCCRRAASSFSARRAWPRSCRSSCS
jgi:hypothetical protein